MYKHSVYRYVCICICISLVTDDLNLSLSPYFIVRLEQAAQHQLKLKRFPVILTNVSMAGKPMTLSHFAFFNL